MEDCSSANAQLIANTVFKPLQKDLGAEILDLYSLQNGLEDGRLLHPREAEIMLWSHVTVRICEDLH